MTNTINTKTPLYSFTSSSEKISIYYSTDNVRIDDFNKDRSFDSSKRFQSTDYYVNCIVAFNTYEFRVHIDGEGSFTVKNNVTANCQLGAISCFYVLLKPNFNTKQMLIDIFSNLSGHGIKNIYFIDIQKSYSNALESRIDKKYIISKTPYNSTNGSKMVTYLLNISALLGDNIK